MIVENKAGAGTSIGAAFVSREAPDGYTILMATNSTLVTNRYLYKELPYDPDGFAPIGMVSVGPLVLLSSPKRPFASTRDLVDYAKQNPQADLRHLRPRHLVAPGRRTVQAARRHRHPARAVQGATQALPALISGDVDLFFDMVATGMPQAAAGKVKVFAITSPGRLATEPALPTLAEQGYQGFDMTAWFSFVAPRGTPEPVLERLRKALADALADDAVKQRLLGMGIDPRSGTPAELQAQIRNEQPIVSQLIKQAGVALQ